MAFCLLSTGVDANIMADQPAAAVDAARRIRDLGQRLNDPDLVAVGLNGEGRALMRSGAVTDGLALLDEAMVTVLNGRPDPFLTGVLYCHTIAACHEVGDVLRMTRWAELAERWAHCPASGGGIRGDVRGAPSASLCCCAGRGTRLSRVR